MCIAFETLIMREESAVLFAEIAAPPMNLLGPELVRDLVSLIRRGEADVAIQVLVFKNADPDYFISHVDVTRIKGYRDEATKLTREASIALLFRNLSAGRLITIAQIEGRVRGAGSEFVLACDMRFASRESAIFGQPEPAFGLVPGGGGVQYPTRLIGRACTLEVMLSAEDYDAQLAERLRLVPPPSTGCTTGIPCLAKIATGGLTWLTAGEVLRGVSASDRELPPISVRSGTPWVRARRAPASPVASRLGPQGLRPDDPGVSPGAAIIPLRTSSN